jgi:hypothetical protein
MNTNLLKEAIADADAIKKMAIENAKASLNEAFDSKIKSMLTARLEEEADDLEEEYGEEDEAALFEKKKKDMGDDEEEKKHAEPDEDNMGGESDEDEDNMKKSSEEDEADEGFNLDELLAELEADEMGKDDKVMEAPEEDEDEAYEAKESEEDGEVYEAEDEDDAEEEAKEDMDEEIDIQALLAELAGDDDEEKEEKEEKEEEKDEVATLEEEMMSLLEKMKRAKAAKEKKEDEPKESEELQEIRRQAAELTQKVNETNLINAKLLYLNKILRKYNLSEQQKIKVISAFDKAETVNESKIVHESLDQAFSVKNDNVKSGLKESIGFASSAAGTSTKRVINESVVGDVDKQVSRWQKLAGIIK